VAETEGTEGATNPLASTTPGSTQPTFGATADAELSKVKSLRIYRTGSDANTRALLSTVITAVKMNQTSTLAHFNATNRSAANG
jgi:hypothetical protein